jgi:hypothetical protein
MSLLQSPPAALRQGIPRTAVDHVVDVDVLAPVTSRGPQTGNRADGILTLALALPVTLTLSSPPSRRRGDAVWEVILHSVEMFPSQEIFSRLISVPVRPSNLRMAIP